jgi:hypothetical protein
MRTRVLAYIDLTALGIVGAVAGQHWCLRAIRQPYATPEDIGAALGAAAAVLIGLDLFGVQQRPESRGLGPGLARVTLSLFGAIVGARSAEFFCAWDFARPRLHFFSLMFFVGFVLTYGLARLLKAFESGAARTEDEPRPRRWLFGLRCLLPAGPLVILWLLVGVPSLGAALLAGLGAVLGVTWFSTFCLWQDASEPGTTRPARIERAAGLVACAGVLAVARLAYMSLSGFMLRSIVTEISVASMALVCGTVLSMAMTNRLGNGREEGLGLVPWFRFSGPRCLLILLVVGFGAVIGSYAVQVACLCSPYVPDPVVDPGALIAGLVAVLLVSGLSRSGCAGGRVVLETLDLAVSFLRIAVPVGLVLFLAAAYFVDRLGGGYRIFLMLMYGPLVGGTLGMLWRAYRLYHPLPGHEWAVVAWGWAVMGFFALRQQENLKKVFNPEDTVPAVLLVAPVLLILLALMELFGREEAEVTQAGDRILGQGDSGL